MPPVSLVGLSWAMDPDRRLAAALTHVPLNGPLPAQPNRHTDQRAGPRVRLSRRNQSKTKIDPFGGGTLLGASLRLRSVEQPRNRSPVDACMRECPECLLDELRMCDAFVWLSECRLHVAAAMPSREGLAHRTRAGQGPPRQCSMRWWSGVKPWRTPHRTAWVRLVTSILR